MKFLTLIFPILNISTICICTNVPMEKVYPPPPNEQQGAMLASVPIAMATEKIDDEFDDILKYNSEEIRQIMALVDEDIEKQENIPAKIGQQSIQLSKLNASNLHRSLPLTSENQQNLESATNVVQESQFNKGKAPIIGAKRSFYEKHDLPLRRDNRRKVDNEINNFNRGLQNNQYSNRIMKEGRQNSTTNAENVPYSWTSQQQMMDQNPPKMTRPSTAKKAVKEKPFKCNWNGCGQTFALSQSWKRHERAHQSIDKKPFKCNWNGCGQTFAHSWSRNRHEQTHQSENKFVCEKCGMGFTRNDYLTRHLQRKIPCIKQENLLVEKVTKGR